MAKFFLFPFADSGDKTTIPEDTQPSGAVSYETGFGADYQKNLATDPDAKPIPRNQFNQLMYDVTNAIRQYQTLGVPDFITTADNGGSPFPYAIFAQVRYDDGVNGFQVYESLEDANTTLPTDVSKWRVVSNNLLGTQAGTIIDWAGPVAPTGYLACDGSAVSRTTYAQLFANITNTQNGTTSNGSPIVTALTDTSFMYVGMPLEGTNIPAATTILTIDSATQVTMTANATGGATVPITFFPWNNGNGTTTFNIPDLRRRTTIGNGGTGTVTIGEFVGNTGGAETHTLTIAEMPGHTHNAETPTSNILGQVGAGGPFAPPLGNGVGVVGNVATEGGDGAHNIMQPSAVVYKCIKT